MKPLVAELLFQDAEYKTAKKQLLQRVLNYSGKLTEISPPQDERLASYEEVLRAFEQDRGQALFYPYLGSGMGNGALVELADGSVKYDLISGIGTHFGHCHPKVLEAVLDAFAADIAMQGNLQQNQDSAELTTLLTRHSGFEHCFLSSSGAIANENGLKIIFQKKNPAHRILAFERCFMGRTLALSQITDKAAAREGLPHNLHVDYVSFYDWKAPEESTRKALNQIKTYLKRHPKQYACMCFELIQGEAGSYPGTQAFFESLMQLLKEHDIAIFVDEVQTFGRTDSLFAFQHFKLQKYVDVVSCGKLAHTCATLYRPWLKPKPGLISQTYTAATSSIRVAKAIIQSLIEDDFLGLEGKNMQIRQQIVLHLQDLANRYPEAIEGPFGYGLMIAFTPFKGEAAQAQAFARELFQAGLITFIAGSSPTRIRFLVPAGGMDTKAIETMALVLETTIKTHIEKQAVHATR